MKFCNFFKSISVFAACAVFMCGCGSEISELSDAQTQQVGEYAAFAMLRYDAEHRSRLVDYAEVEAADEFARLAAERAAEAELARQTETAEAEDETPEGPDAIDKTEDQQSGDTGYASDTMEDFLELPSGMLLSYKGYTVQSSYPEDADISEYFVVDATAGKKFLVLWYSIYNGSGSDVNVNFLSDNIAFKCRVNDGTTATALVTMLNDDMSTLQLDLRDNEEIDAVLIFEIDESLANNIDSISVKLSKNGSEWERRVL